MIWDVFLKGVVMGLAVAAPVGPIGVLCIRRTLADGRVAGLATGMGAATADATYGLLVAIGFAATGVLISYADPMAIGGGLLLMWLGASSVRSFFGAKGSSGKIGPAKSHGTLLKSWLATFFLTMANPLTILTFIGMIAGLGAAANASPNAPYWLVAGVFVGSALWWLFLVQLALTIRSRMTPQLTRWFDLMSGVVLMLWGAQISVSGLG